MVDINTQRVCRCTYMQNVMKGRPICTEKHIPNRFGDCSNRLPNGTKCGHEKACHENQPTNQ